MTTTAWGRAVMWRRRVPQSGASQLLLIVDTCFSGEAVAAGEVAARIMQRSPPEGEHVWVGVLTSCLPAETARDGLFGQRLAGLLESGPGGGSGHAGAAGAAVVAAERVHPRG